MTSFQYMRVAAAVVLMTLIPSGIQAQEQAMVHFDRGTQALQEGRFREAIAAYDQARSSGHTSAELLHNTGVAWYRLDDVGRATLFLERASVLAPDDERIAHSLSIVQRLHEDTFSILPVPFWMRAHRWILDHVGSGVLFGVGASFLFLWGSVAGLRLLAGRPVPQSRRLERWSLIVAVPALLLALYSSAFPPWPDRAIVLAESVALTEQAASGSTPVEQLHAGTTVHIQARGDGWVLVRLTNGVEGWLPGDAIESV
jgi:tetratricopeptide (TPR) repeat protein